jgi:hypothetical protein
MNLLDYNNIEIFKMTLNGHTRFEFSLVHLNMFVSKKYILNNNEILFYLNFELETTDDLNNDIFQISTDINELKKIYANSLNCSRIDSIVFSFELNSTNLNDDIYISSIYANLLNIFNNDYLYYEY